MKKINMKTFVCLLVVLSLTTFTFAKHEHGNSAVKEQLHDYFTQLTETEYFTGSVLVAEKGKVLLEKGFGMADYEKNKPNNKNTIFYMASLGKAFTSMSIMILEERGLLSVDDTIADYIPEFPNGESITLHQLLTHTSGLFDFPYNPLLWPNMDKYHTPDEMLEYFMYEPLNFDPGTQWEYCNSGFVTLGVIIERVSGLTYREFIEQNILTPLQMHHTGYDPDEVDFPNKRAVGYDDITVDPPVLGMYIHPSIVYAAGGHYSTVKDLYKWDQALYTEKLVSAETLDRIFTPGLGGYGYGWYIDELGINSQMHKHVWHWGDYPAFHSFFSRLVDDEITVIILCNKPGASHTPDDLGLVAKEAAGIVLGNE